MKMGATKTAAFELLRVQKMELVGVFFQENFSYPCTEALILKAAFSVGILM